jgi:hypothetical protein
MINTHTYIIIYIYTIFPNKKRKTGDSLCSCKTALDITTAWGWGAIQSRVGPTRRRRAGRVRGNHHPAPPCIINLLPFAWSWICCEFVYSCVQVCCCFYVWIRGRCRRSRQHMARRQSRWDAARLPAPFPWPSFEVKQETQQERSLPSPPFFFSFLKINLITVSNFEVSEQPRPGGWEDWPTNKPGNREMGGGKNQLKMDPVTVSRSQTTATWEKSMVIFFLNEWVSCCRPAIHTMRQKPVARHRRYHFHVARAHENHVLRSDGQPRTIQSINRGWYWDLSNRNRGYN